MSLYVDYNFPTGPETASKAVLEALAARSPKTLQKPQVSAGACYLHVASYGVYVYRVTEVLPDSCWVESIKFAPHCTSTERPEEYDLALLSHPTKIPASLYDDLLQLHSTYSALCEQAINHPEKGDPELVIRNLGLSEFDAAKRKVERKICF